MKKSTVLFTISFLLLLLALFLAFRYTRLMSGGGQTSFSGDTHLADYRTLLVTKSESPAPGEM